MSQLTAMKLAIVLLAPAAGPTANVAGQERDKPRLVLQITVDQLRGDLPMRCYKRLAIP